MPTADSPVASNIVADNGAQAVTPPVPPTPPPFVPPTPPQSITSVTKTIPAYPYVEYQNDEAVTAFFDAYNIYSQAYTDWFNALNFPIYTQSPVVGPLLDWVGQSIYGIIRPSLPTALGAAAVGPVNTWTANMIPVNGYVPGLPDTYTATSDDTYRRIITWAFYKGDGKVFSPRWLKRRINRFLSGANGTNVLNDTTYNVSVYPTAPKQWTIKLATSAISTIFKIGVETGALELPFQITWTVDLI